MLIILNAVNGLGNRTILKLLNALSSIKDIFDKVDWCVDQKIISEKIAENIKSFPASEFLKNEKQLALKHGVNIITIEDKHYPEFLKEIADAPVCLYYKGNISLLKDDFRLAIVGSRQASVYGRQIAEKFAVQCAERGVTVVSGLARGIDTAAHHGIINVGGKTIAVCGCGLTIVYPPENSQLMNNIARTGLILSEFPLTTQPRPFNFPRRNRLISGISDGVIVVEASQKSGALITADFALEQGKDVYAVPGPIDSPSAKGTNALIQQGAKLVTSIEEVLEEMNFKEIFIQRQFNKHSTEKLKLLQNLSHPQEQVFHHIDSHPKHMDELSMLCGESNLPLSKILIELEFKQLIKQLPGKFYVIR